MKIFLEQTQIRIFNTQIRRSLDGYTGYDSIIKEVVIEARKLSVNEMEVFDVDRGRFSLVTHLAINGCELLSKCNDETPLSESDMRELLSIFSI